MFVIVTNVVQGPFDPAESIGVRSSQEGVPFGQVRLNVVGPDRTDLGPRWSRSRTSPSPPSTSMA